MTNLKAELIKKEKKRQAKIDELLLEIAKKHSMAIHDRGDLEKRHTDSEDFLDMSVWTLKEMLRDAYRAGTRNNI